MSHFAYPFDSIGLLDIGVDGRVEIFGETRQKVWQASLLWLDLGNPDFFRP
jgi:hypothetical protein